MREHFAEYLLLYYVLYAFALRSFLTTSGCLKSPIGLYSCAPLAQLALCALFLLLPMLLRCCLGWYDTCLLFLNYIKYLKHMQI